MTISSPVGAREGSDLDSIGKRLEWFTVEVDMMQVETKKEEDRNFVRRRSKKDFDNSGSGWGIRGYVIVIIILLVLILSHRANQSLTIYPVNWIWTEVVDVRGGREANCHPEQNSIPKKPNSTVIETLRVLPPFPFHHLTSLR